MRVLFLLRQRTLLITTTAKAAAGVDFGTIVKVGTGVVLGVAVGVKYGVPLVKKGFKHIKEKIASKKAKKDEVIDVESKDVTSDEETCEEK